ncbi:MAG: hypothetical protein EAZ73_09235 [Oscillatoriales cyanobacterium]|nr:hypothetical protein [Microcoleus sp. PH2017_11_PCY_U_A]TAF00843.1 MAG: hypothetical protein EAZ79_01360 [Oscillatoriales cyanobacterium]TAF21398.1 MAG: hypothetical protein EAZ73_09235 [Oscillatoriales cyanobacterium]TAF39675.1 MAG: hypothetical protein EAZ69_00110 [Oscillatoriales cyanobacterium]
MSFNTKSVFNSGSNFNSGSSFNSGTGSSSGTKTKKPVPTTKIRTLTVNKCGYVVLSNTASYPLSKLVSVNGISRGSINPIAFVPSGKEKSPSCKVGSYGAKIQSRHFSHNNKLYVFSSPAGPGAKIKLVYDK